MSSSRTPECRLMMDVLTGDCTEEERSRFELHLPRCPSCQREWGELQEVWEELPMDMEDMEVPEDLKQEVMNSIFQPQRESGRSSNKKKPSIAIGWLWHRPAALIASVAVVCLGLGLWLGGYMQEGRFIGGKQALQQPMKEIHELALYSTAASMPEAKGQVSLLQRGNAKILVIAMNGLRPNEGDQVYQAWLIHGSERYNCGTFRVNGDGKGLLTYQLTEPDVQIDGIGITLEPDSDGSVPRGVKVAGTKPA